MRRIILFIAMSLDGYIADEKGGVDWLSGTQTEEDGEDSYSHFIKEIDTVVIGWNTAVWKAEAGEFLPEYARIFHVPWDSARNRPPRRRCLRRGKLGSEKSNFSDYILTSQPKRSSIKADL